MEDIIKNVEAEKECNGHYGFTLLDTIFSLFVLSLIVFIFPIMIEFFKPPLSNQLNTKETELFFMQISKEIHGAKQLHVNKDKLYITLKNDDVASYGHHGSLIRRQVNDSGQEICLYNIESVSFHTNELTVTIQINGRNGQHFERKFVLLGESI